MRASGIPAQYVEGTLSYAQAQTLILSMFPASYQTVGYIPAGTQTSDPADDSQLLERDREPLLVRVQHGQRLGERRPADGRAPSSGRHSRPRRAHLPRWRRACGKRPKSRSLRRSTARPPRRSDSAAIACPTTVVLDQTFNDVDLVGRPLTIGNFVSTSSFGALFLTTTTNTYTPYIVVGDDALPDSQLPDAIIGQQYQEVLTNFPLASQILTGLFLNITLEGAGTTSQPYSQTLVDRIGYAARQGMATPENLSVNPSSPPIITPFDLTTLNILPGLQSPGAAQLLQERANQELASVSSETNPTTVDQTDALMAFARAELANFAVASDQETANLESGFSVAAYSDVPRITTFSSQLVTTNNQSTISYSIDLVHDSLRAIASPGQNVQAPLGFAFARGVFDSFLEGQVLPTSPGSQNLSAAAIVQQSMNQGIPLAVITASNLSLLQSLNLPADAIARITTNVQNGLTVFVPTQALTVNGTQTTAWFNYNPTTGEMLAESESGGNQGLTQLAFVLTSVSLGIVFMSQLDFWLHNGHIPAWEKAAKVAALAFLTKTYVPATPVGGIVNAVLALNALIDPPLAPVTVNLSLPYPNSPGATSSTELDEQPSECQARWLAPFKRQPGSPQAT